MSALAEKVIPILDATPARRCPDFDDDCADVPDHTECWRGAIRPHGSMILFTPQAQGYCPYLIGMKS